MANSFNYCLSIPCSSLLHFLNLVVGSYESGFYYHFYATFGRRMEMEKDEKQFNLIVEIHNMCYFVAQLLD